MCGWRMAGAEPPTGLWHGRGRSHRHALDQPPPPLAASGEAGVVPGSGRGGGRVINKSPKNLSIASRLLWTGEACILIICLINLSDL